MSTLLNKKQINRQHWWKEFQEKKAVKKQLISVFGLSCFWCRCTLPEKELTLDHQIPGSKGGSNNPENLRLACFPCNNSRGNSLFPPERIYNLHGMSTIP